MHIGVAKGGPRGHATPQIFGTYSDCALRGGIRSKIALFAKSQAFGPSQIFGLATLLHMHIWIRHISLNFFPCFPVWFSAHKMCVIGRGPIKAVIVGYLLYR